MVQGGISDKLQIFEEATYDAGSGTEVVFGKTVNFSWDAEASVEQNHALEADGPQANFNIDGVVNITGTHEWELTDGRELKAIMGALPTNTGGEFVLDISKVLPSYAIKAINEDAENENVLITGVKYGEATITFNRDEPITISANWTGRRLVETGSFTPTVATNEPMVYLDGSVSVSGVAQTGVDNVSLTINRNIVARRFIEDTTVGERRYISRLIEGALSITLDGAQTANKSVIERIWGGGSMQDVRTDVPLVMKAAQGARELELTLSGTRFTNVSRTLDKQQEVALNEFSGVALDIDGEGTF